MVSDDFSRIVCSDDDDNEAPPLQKGFWSSPPLDDQRASLHSACDLDGWMDEKIDR